MILLDGKKLSEKILNELKTEIAKFGKKIRLAVVLVGENPVVNPVTPESRGLKTGREGNVDEKATPGKSPTLRLESNGVKKFVEQKRKAAEFLGVEFRIFSFPGNITTNELRQRLTDIAHEKRNTGIIIQLPLPEQISSQYILNSITPEKDVDVLSARAVGDFAVGKSKIMPPVAGAVKAFLEEYKIDLRGKDIVVVGAGNLVGKPIALWLANEKVGFSLLETGNPNPEEIIKRADILISGVGKPEFIKGDWIKKGAVVIDAGTSEARGKLVGDVEFAEASKRAGYLTPVPGGVGPVTVAVVYKNLTSLYKKQR